MINKMKRSSATLCIVMVVLLVFSLIFDMSATTVNAATVRLKKDYIRLIPNQTYQLEIKGTSKKVKWSSNKKSVAKVSSKGVVTALKKGSAVITAKVGGKKYTCDVDVLKKTFTYNHTVPLNPYTQSWQMIKIIENPTSKNIEIVGLRIVDKKDGEVVRDKEWPLNVLGLSSYKIPAQGSITQSDSHPYVTDFNARDVNFKCQDEDGVELTIKYEYKLAGKLEIPYSSETNNKSDYKHYKVVSLDTIENAWHFNTTIKNPLNKTIYIKKVRLLHLKSGCVIEDVLFSTDYLGLPRKLGPKKSYKWQDNHPYTKDFDGNAHIYECETASGKKITLTYVFELAGGDADPESRYAKDTGKDLLTLRHNANYKVSVGDGVYWVPANTLGKSSYTNAQIYKMINLKPEEKQSKIDTLYEAIQLFQIGNFESTNDNIRIAENGINWEHHKPGYYSVKSNCGCCASDTSWLTYILSNDYDEIGCIGMSHTDGGGHVINYIKNDGWYYIVDLTHYVNSFIKTAKETGKMSDFYDSDFVLGNVLAVKDLKDYVNYYVKNAFDSPGLFYQEKLEYAPPLDGIREGSKVTMVFGSDIKDKITFIYDNPNDQLYYKFITPPKNKPDWAAICR